jgi:hypothetical protein
MKKLVKRVARRSRDFLAAPVLEAFTEARFSDPTGQLQLMLSYQALRRSGGPMPKLQDIGFQVHSQADEDGILLYIFSIIGTETKKSVEICAGDGIESCAMPT